MLTRLRTRASDESGFTLIELLVVVLIIGILAAIAIPSFLSQRTKAQDAAAKTDARTAQTAQETYYTNENTYADAKAKLVGVEKTLDNSTLLDTVTGSDTGFTVAAKNPKSESTFTITRAGDGTVTRTCAPTGKGACPGNGNW